VILRRIRGWFWNAEKGKGLFRLERKIKVKRRGMVEKARRKLYRSCKRAMEELKKRKVS
jgi:hypothetical protein